VIDNIRTLKKMIDDPQRLRPHVKTHKSKQATQLFIKEGINKFKCATIAEAEMLGLCSATDVLLAYQPVGPKVDRLCKLVKKYTETKFSCLIDNGDAAREIASVFSTQGLSLKVYIDLNTGMGRTGITPDAQAIQLYMDCSQLKGIKIIGFHAYDGHIHDADFSLRKKRCDESFAPVEKLKMMLVEMGFSEPLIIAGGSPTFSIHCKREKIECSPGTFIYWDKGYVDICPEQDFIPAALVITRVISLPDKNKLCLDLGHKSIASENELSRRVFFLNGPELKAISHSEEHLLVEVEKGHSYKTGDVFYGLPYHICPTCALYEKAFTIENGKVTGEWQMIARDRMITV
jgi:D-serine deaminase-like pyridoxal phosphate-dependent protein